VRALFGLEPQDVRPVVGLGLVHAALGAAIAAGDAAVQASFLSRAGSDRLWVVLAANAVLNPVLVTLFARSLSGRSSRTTMAGAALFAVATSAAGLVAIGLTRSGPLAIAAYVAHEIASTVVTVHWGVYLLAYLSGPAAVRAVPVVYAASRGGAAVAGLALAPLTALGGPAAGLGLALVAFALAAVLARRTRRPERASPDSIPPTAAKTERGSAWRLLGRSPLLRAIALCTGAMILARVLLRFQQQTLLETHGEQALVRLLALYTVAANVVGIVLQIGVVGRLLARLGLVRTNLLYALATVVAQLVMASLASVPAALVARFVDGELKEALKTPLSSLFYEAFPRSERAPARTAVLSGISPATQLLAAVVLVALGSAAPGWAATGAGAAVCVVFVAVTVLQNRRYEAAIRRGSLGAGADA